MEIFLSGDPANIEHALATNPGLASKELPLPNNPSALAHPLHRICDAVSSNYFSEATGIKIAELFLKYGGSVNIDNTVIKDSPLTAACSMQCDDLALFYIERGAHVSHRGCHGGTALHWSAWCGRDYVLRKLVTMNPDINQQCIDFKATPLFWAIHGYNFGGGKNRHHQIECAGILLEHGADPSIPNFEGYLPIQLVEKHDRDMLSVFGK